jgi:hypothetical protein
MLVLAGAAAGATAVALASDSHDTTWRDVAPVFAAKCATCHNVSGVAPFPLTTARDASSVAGAILAATQTGAMPPWMPGRDSPVYLGQSERILTPAEKALIANWVKGGAHTSGGGAISPPRVQERAPGTTITLSASKAYMPKPALGGLDDYHCSLLEPHLSHDVFVTSAVVQPQQAAIVHHVILYEAAGANAAEARRLNRASGGQGWTCFGGPGLDETRGTGAGSGSRDSLGAPEWISAWAPGHTQNDLPAGTGVLLHAGAAVVMQVHYNLIHPPRPDRSRVVLRILPAAGAKLTPLHTLLMPAPVELACPRNVHSRLCTRTAALANEAKQYGQDAAYIPLALNFLCGRQPVPSVTTSCERHLDHPIRIYGVAGHMHLRGVDIRLELDPGTSHARTLLHIPHWNFHWQDAYYLAHPIDANPGDTIRVTCRFDNSAKRQPIIDGKRLAPRYVLWGEGTTDEMCLGLLEVADR